MPSFVTASWDKLECQKFCGCGGRKFHVERMIKALNNLNNRPKVKYCCIPDTVSPSSITCIPARHHVTLFYILQSGQTPCHPLPSSAFRPDTMPPLQSPIFLTDSMSLASTTFNPARSPVIHFSHLHSDQIPCSITFILAKLHVTHFYKLHCGQTPCHQFQYLAFPDHFARFYNLSPGQTPCPSLLLPAFRPDSTSPLVHLHSGQALFQPSPALRPDSASPLVRPTFRPGAISAITCIPARLRITPCTTYIPAPFTASISCTDCLSDFQLCAIGEEGFTSALS